MAEQYPVFIPVRDRLAPLRDLVAWLERVGQQEIWLIDNDSTFGPLVEYLDASPHHVVRLGHNVGQRSPFLSGAVQRHAFERHFVVTDPDVVPDEGCPDDALDHFRELLDRHPHIDKVGFGLRIDDLPDHYPLKQSVIDWEGEFWSPELEIERGVFQAPIDTTFALYRPLTDRRHRMDLAFRTGLPYVARHVPWYQDPANLSDDDVYYRDHADATISNWDRDQLPWWKQRALGDPTVRLG